VQSLAGAKATAVAVKDDGTVVAWGKTSGSSTVPPGLTGVQTVAAGWLHFLALKKDGTIMADHRSRFH